MYKIKDLRIDKDFKQVEIANLLNITQRNYSYIETGKSDVPSQILIELSKIYGVSVDYILGLTDVMKPYPRRKEKNNENN